MSVASALGGHSGAHGEPTTWSTLLCTRLLGCVLLILGLFNYSRLKSLAAQACTMLTRVVAEHQMLSLAATMLRCGNQRMQQDRTDSNNDVRPQGPQQCSLSGANSNAGSATVVPQQQGCGTEGGLADAAPSSTPSAQPHAAPGAAVWGMQTSATSSVPLPADAADAAAAALAAHAEGARQRLQACRAMVGQRRYRRLYHDHKAVLKVPGAMHPSDLDPIVLPSLVSSVHSRPGFTVTNVAARAGCLLLKLDLKSDRHTGAEGSVRLDHSLAASAQQWLQDSGLADQVPAGVPVLLQLDGLVMRLVLDASSRAWSVADTYALEECPQDTLTILAPAILLTPSSAQQQQQQVQDGGTLLKLQAAERQHQPEARGLQGVRDTQHFSSSSSHHVTVHALVCLPSPCELSGWAGSADASPSLALPAQQHEGAACSPSSPITRMRMVASIHGYGYVPTHVEWEEHTLNRGDGGPSRKLAQVHVTLPTELAASSAVHTLSLELWHSHALHAQAAALLLPPQAHEAAAELQCPPWASQHSTHSTHSTDLHDFVADLGVFLGQCAAAPGMQSLQQEHLPLHQQQQHHHHHQQQQQQQQHHHHHQQQQQQQQDGRAMLVWDLGVSLTRQAVLWGMPAVSTLVVEHLMALPHAPDAPFSRLASSSSPLPLEHMPASAQDAAAAGVRANTAGTAAAATAAASAVVAAEAWAAQGPVAVEVPAAAGAWTGPGSEGHESSEPDPGIASADLLGGLLHLALLSPHPQRMLSTVLGWGARWGNTPKDAHFAWHWGEQNAMGFTPLDVLAATPQLAPLLRALLRNPRHGPSVCAAVQSAMSGQAAGSAGRDCGNRSEDAPAAQGSCSEATQHSASGSHYQHTRTISSSSSATPLASQEAHVHAHVYTPTTQPLQQQQERKEQQVCYRQWVVQQAAPLARTFFMVSVVHLLSVIAKAAATGHLSQDLPSMSLVLVPYTAAAVMMHRAPHRLEAICVMCCLARMLTVLSLVLGIFPLPSTFWTGIRYRSGLTMEIVAFSTMEYMRPSRRLLVRVALCACYAPLLQLAGLWHPWLQSVAMHGISFAVSCGVEARYRSVFARWWQKQHKGKVQMDG